MNASVTRQGGDARTSFDGLGLIEPLLRAVRAEGYEAPTPIQQRAIPHVLAGKDLLGLAQTGTGKTAAFALPILQRLHAKGHRPHGGRPVRVLVLSPTRELAAQIGDSFAAYGKHLGYRHSVIFGGVGHEPQRQALRAGVDILVATPGRLLDLAGERVLDLSRLEIFVLDEADRMLDMGFVHDVRKVIAMLPRERQTLFFSATMPPEAQKLADVLLKEPETVAVTPVSSTVERIDQGVYFVAKADKRNLLGDLLYDDQGMKRVLVFTRTKHGANRVAEHLTKDGVRAEAIHGNKSQNARERALENFKTGHTPVLVATDIAARGIDVDDVTHVIQFDLPEVPETYVHRIGRTARAGASGTAIAFCDEEETGLLADIEKLIKKQIPLAGGEIPPWAKKGAPLAYPPPPKRGSQPRQGRGGGGGGGGRHGGGGGGGGGGAKPAAPRSEARHGGGGSASAPRPAGDHGHGRADKPSGGGGRRRRGRGR